MEAFALKGTCDGYSYTQTVDALDDEIVAEARNAFQDMQENGVLEAESFEANIWTMYDDAERPVKLDFSLEEFNFKRVCSEYFGCTYQEYAATMRVAVACCLRYSTEHLAHFCRAMVLVANTIQFDGSFEIRSNMESLLQKFLWLLPCKNVENRDKVIRHLQAVAQNRYLSTCDRADRSRMLCYYQSYLIFDRILSDFWAKATKREKTMYFPVYLWWTLSIVLPLRPTELCLTPRDGLVWHDGKPYLTVRRSKKKGHFCKSSHFVEEDYREESYPIPVTLANEILDYIEATKENYRSPVGNLFCSVTQSKLFNRKSTKQKEVFLRRALEGNLNHFYKHVVQAPPYSYTIREKVNMPLGDGEVERIALGDTRTIAMINLMLSGGSEQICQELAGHDSIETGYAYYGNVKTFIDVLTLEYVKKSRKSLEHDHTLPTQYVRLNDGICISEKTCCNDFSDCECAVSEYGVIGHCRSCSYFRPISGSKTKPEVPDDKLKTAFLHVLDAVSKTKRGLSTQSEVAASAMQLQSQAKQYITKAILNDITIGG